MNLNKKHKLYYFDKNNAVRNLSKTSPKLYERIMNHFFKEGGNEAYMKLNKKAKKTSDLKAIDMVIQLELISELDKVTKNKSIMITYNGSYRKCVELFRK